MAHVAVARTKKSGARPPPVIIFVLSRHNPEGHGLLILKLMPRYDLVFFVRVQRDNKLLFDVDVFLHFLEVRVCLPPPPSLSGNRFQNFYRLQSHDPRNPIIYHLSLLIGLRTGKSAAMYT